MHKCLYLFLFFVITQSSSSFAQHHRGEQDYKSTTHDYYICISGINARADVEKIENTVQKKTGVSLFLGDRFPPRYFLLKSTKAVSEEEFKSWIDTSLYKVEFYGVGIYDKEKALVTGKKLITIRKN